MIRRRSRGPFGDPDFVRTRDARDQIGRYRSCWQFEAPLPAVLAVLAPTLTGAFYDVGANTGFYAALMGRLRPDLVIRAFEPIPEIAQICRDTLQFYGVQAHVHEVALAERAGTAAIYLPPDDHGLVETSASLNRDFKPTIARQIEVPLRRLDDLVAEPIGLVKVDVETYESQVLQGAMATVRRDRPLLVVEVLPQGDAVGLDSLVADLGYVRMALPERGQPEVVDQLAFRSDSWNYLLVPSERADQVLGLIAAAP